MCKYDRQYETFIYRVIDLCREYGFALRPSDPYEGIDIVSLTEDDLGYLTANLPSDLPF